MKVKITQDLRKLYSEKILDLTNIGVGATVFGQFLSEKGLSWAITLTGFGLMAVGYLAGYLIYPAEVKKR